MNGIGPRNFNPNMKADLAKQAKELAKLDEGKALGEAQEANVTNTPEGDTDVNKTVIINYKDNGYEVKYDGVDNGVVVALYDGKFEEMYINELTHNDFRDEGEGLHPYPTEE